MSDAQAVLVAAGQELFATKTKAKAHPAPFLLRHTLFFLPILVLVSLSILLLSLILPPTYRFLRRHIWRRQAIALEDDVEDDVEEVPQVAMPSRGLVSDFKAHVRSLKEYGSILFAMEIVRVLCLAALLALSVYAAVQAESPERKDGFSADKWKKHKRGRKGHKGHHDKSNLDDYSSLEWGEFGVCSFYLYTLLLSLLLLALRPATPLRRHLIVHLDILLLLGFCLYAYRDLWPLLTYHLIPSDVPGPITWSRVSLLAVVAIAIPLLRPRTYVPADPENPSKPEDVLPEQTAPWLFFVFYEFMTGLVWKAWKVPSLPYEELHPLADYDAASHLYKKHVTFMDPIKRKERGWKPRNLFWTLTYTFRFEAVVTTLLCLFSAGVELSSPVAIQQLLQYLETNGKGATLKPIFWIAVLFLGPTLNSLSIQFYIFLMTRALVRSESILTQLIFDHSLRLRMRDAIEEDDEKAEEPEAAGLTINVQDASDASSTEVGSSDGGKPVDPKAAAEKEASKSNGQGIVGKINVLMAADVESVVEGRDLPLVFVYTPVQLVLASFLLYRILSWSAFVGMFAMLITMPIPGWLTKLNAQYQKQRMVATDARIDTVSEVIGGLRMIKMFGWEQRIKERISAKRETEIQLVWKRRIMTTACELLSNTLPIIVMSVTFACYTVIQKQPLTASKVFTSMAVFDFIKGLMGLTFYMANGFVTAFVSLNRIDSFLKTSEMIDEFSEGLSTSTVSPELLEAQEQGLIRVKNATFTWGTNKGDDTPDFKLRIPDLTFVKGKINLITGPTGSGKSSLLKALVGELHLLPHQDAFYHLPREGKVSYAAQESWCMNDTIKDNIIFGETYDEERYRQVIRDCGLETDLTLFDDGDETEIGEKGITLSGGQKARITLARAVYDKAEIVLLDDIFSALDTLTSRWIIEHLFKGSLMQGRTVLLITHHVGLAVPIADFMVALDDTGRVRSAEAIDAELIAREHLDEATVEEVKEAKDEVAPAEKPQEKKAAAKLIQAEEKGEGRISKRAMLSFFSTFGGPVFWLTAFGFLFTSQALNSFQTWWLGHWAKAYAESDDWRDVSVAYYLGLYTAFIFAGLAALIVADILYFLGAIKASRTIHQKLVDAIFGSYMRFLDATPVGRIISRFTKDMKAIDGSFPETFQAVAEMTISLIIKFFVVVYLVPVFSVPAVVIGVVGGIIGELYIHGQLSVKREMSNAKSPLFSHFSSAVGGIVSIRAYGAQEKLRAEARRRADKYTRTARAFYNLNRWVTIRIDMLGGFFASLLAAFLIYGPKLDASTAGFALSQAISFSSLILWWVRLVNEMEVQGNSVERIEDYLTIEQEPKSIPSKQPPAAWPTSGEIILEKLSAKYAPDSPTVLDNLEVRIASGEKVGIVGRTGSGKSTLALALLRMIPTTGSVIIDGRRTESVNLEALRSQVTIIPQDPILLSGSLRFNLDPFGDHEDATLNDALQASGLGQVKQSTSGTATPQRITLDYQISAGGSNLSQGQRQLVALARALVRSSKVLILDEATASVDFETDELIQRSIRSLPSSTTVLTVAHRLSTVMDYDKIMVLGAGKLLEYDSPENLKRNKYSYFAKLVQAMEG